MNNIDTVEQSRFDALASEWWNPDGKLRTLHDINPLRLEYISGKVHLTGKSILDTGCGGGLLCEAMAKAGSRVTGIDISNEAIFTAAQHSKLVNLEIEYFQSSPEQLAETNPQSFDVVTCMELLEHVPEPVSVIQACSILVKPGGHIFFSTINRSAMAYLQAILGAEYILKLIPRNTHDFARFIRPSELATWCRECNLSVQDISGMVYLPFSRKAYLKRSPDVNYFLYARKF